MAAFADYRARKLVRCGLRGWAGSHRSDELGGIWLRAGRVCTAVRRPGTGKRVAVLVAAVLVVVWQNAMPELLGAGVCVLLRARVRARGKQCRAASGTRLMAPRNAPVHAATHHQGPCFDADGARFERVEEMNAVHLVDALHHTLLDHPFRARPEFLGRLEQKLDAAVHLIGHPHCTNKDARPQRQHPVVPRGMPRAEPKSRSSGRQHRGRWAARATSKANAQGQAANTMAVSGEAVGQGAVVSPRILAVASNIATWPSCPHACMQPAFWLQ